MSLVAAQLLVPGLYLPPVLKTLGAIALRPTRSFRCQSTLPCDSIGQLARWSCSWPSNCWCRDCIFRRCSNRTQSSSTTPDDHFAASPDCRVIDLVPAGALVVLVAVQLFGAGIVSAAGIQRCAENRHPPQTIISLPVHTAV